ncbi:hypothetical protein HDV05_008265, partial [Chytridiales sp. JEL 0842]
MGRSLCSGIQLNPEFVSSCVPVNKTTTMSTGRVTSLATSKTCMDVPPIASQTISAPPSSPIAPSTAAIVTTKTCMEPPATTKTTAVPCAPSTSTLAATVGTATCMEGPTIRARTTFIVPTSTATANVGNGSITTSASARVLAVSWALEVVVGVLML